MSRRTTRMLVAAAVLTALGARDAAAGPMGLVQQTTDKILDVLSDESLAGEEKKEERRAKIMAAVDERFHWSEMARRALARHWRKRSDAEKEEFTDLFTQLVRRAYMSKIEGYSGEKVAYGEEEVEGRYARVHMTITTKKNTDIPVIYSMKNYDGNWRVYDVAIEGVRLVHNYRTQFSGMLDRMSYQEFVDKLRQKATGKAE